MPEIRRNTYAQLLAGLLLYLLAVPLTDYYLDEVSALLIDATMLVPIVIGVWSLKRGTLWLRTGLVLAAVIVALQLVNIAVAHVDLEWIVRLLALVFFFMMMGITLEDVLFGGPIDANRLVGSVCAYLLLGVAWALLYGLLDLVTEQAAFSNLDPSARAQDAGAYLYYSFVTLTSLGYGDIAPLTPLARTLAFLEVICGQFYLTILVAALVGMLLSRRPPREANGSG